VTPLIFVVFAENVFKYGVSACMQRFIYIEVRIEGRRLLFVCRNSVIPGQKKSSSKGPKSSLAAAIAGLFSTGWPPQSEKCRDEAIIRCPTEVSS
jgi:hypothetical protein